MLSAIRPHASPVRPAALLILPLLLSMLCPGAASFAQQNSPASAGGLSLEHRSPAQIDPADASVLRKHQRDIAREAAFFGYNIADPGWSYDQAVCPFLPDDLLLHYSRRSRHGAQSLFTALVPRTAGRVYVVPVLYRNATPFESAIGSPRSLAVFNRAVPADIAQKAAQPGSQWLRFALCYAELAGAEPKVPQNTSGSTALVRAPDPTMRISDDTNPREILFSDRIAPGHYNVWNITLNAHGRITAASARTLDDYVALPASEVAPREKVMPGEPRPGNQKLPPASQPDHQAAPQ